MDANCDEADTALCEHLAERRLTVGRFILEMETGNAAFRREDESLDIDSMRGTLHAAIEQIFQPGSPYPAKLEICIRDENGNSVGTMTLEEWL